jgi:hypothetical protein
VDVRYSAKLKTLVIVFLSLAFYYFGLSNAIDVLLGVSFLTLLLLVPRLRAVSPDNGIGVTVVQRSLPRTLIARFEHTQVPSTR